MKGTKPQLVVIDGATAPFPPPPGWLSETAKAEWRRMQPFLEERRYLSDIDLSNLENYCVAQGRVRECEADISGCADLEVKAKLWRMQKQAMDTARQLAAELGLTPISRSRPVMRDLFSQDEDNDPIHLS